MRKKNNTRDVRVLLQMSERDLQVPQRLDQSSDTCDRTNDKGLPPKVSRDRPTNFVVIVLNSNSGLDIGLDGLGEDGM